MLKFDTVDIFRNYRNWRKNDKVHSFVEIVFDNNLFRYYECILAGGSLRTLLDKKEEVKDFDIFFFNIKKAPDVERLLIKFHQYEVIFKCPEGKLTSLYNKKEDIKIQLITEKNYVNAEHLLNEFDINACRFAWDLSYLYTFKEAIRDVMFKCITLNKVTYPNATMKRIAKYINKGYTLTNEGVTTFVNEIYNMGVTQSDLNNRFYID
jgi:hypothetical protein